MTTVIINFLSYLTDSNPFERHFVTVPAAVHKHAARGCRCAIRNENNSNARKEITLPTTWWLF